MTAFTILKVGAGCQYTTDIFFSVDRIIVFVILNVASWIFELWIWSSLFCPKQMRRPDAISVPSVGGLSILIELCLVATEFKLFGSIWANKQCFWNVKIISTLRVYTSTHIATISKLLENWPLFDVVFDNFAKEGCGCKFVSCKGVELEGVG